MEAWSNLIKRGFFSQRRHSPEIFYQLQKLSGRSVNETEKNISFAAPFTDVIVWINVVNMEYLQRPREITLVLVAYWLIWWWLLEVELEFGVAGCGESLRARKKEINEWFSKFFFRGFCTFWRFLTLWATYFLSFEDFKNVNLYIDEYKIQF